jgi:hypothetical protein
VFLGSQQPYFIILSKQLRWQGFNASYHCTVPQYGESGDVTVIPPIAIAVDVDDVDDVDDVGDVGDTKLLVTKFCCSIVCGVKSDENKDSET